MGNDSMSSDSSIQKYIDNIFDLIGDGIYISDRNGRTLNVNSMYENLSGLKRDKILGRNVKYLVDKGIFDIILNPTIVKTGKPVTSLQIGKKGKKLVLNGYPIFDDDGEVALVVTFVRDVTLLEQLKEKIHAQRRLVEKYKTNVRYINEEESLKRPLITNSPVMQNLIRDIENISTTDATILLQGETGVGKDVFARKIHQASSRVDKAFVKVDCPSIPESLFESELFGYAPGAFSGANKKGKLGFFEMADKGTLFLDEIGELPLLMQAKLLRALQDREIVRLGSTKLHKVNVRLISATNRDLESEVRAGRFRSDLFYRLRVAVITIPPLRDRKEDVVPFAEHFLNRYASRYKRELHFDKEILEVLKRYEWPGNIRELENLVQSLVINRKRGAIGAADLPSNIVGRGSNDCRVTSADVDAKDPKEPPPIDLDYLESELKNGKRSLKSIMKDIEVQILKATLKMYGSKEKVAKRFKVNRSTLFRKLRFNGEK